ncbi:hypothetical protein [Bacillus sp. Marseille-P3800]|uniref:hypothetical protein n=1 Tax=Bacillus sp. Marseille-P3800 TaxID=2014782 RepID=UPI000C078BC9|nr:hypothetical protein [Bacillus sp. Marseille-P3800]
METLPEHGTTLVADVFDMLVIDKDGNVILEDVLTAANISGQTESNDVRGGQGNGLFAVLHNSKEIEITQNSPVFNLQSLAMHMGSDISTGKGDAYAAPETHTVVDGKIKLKKTPLSNDTVKIKVAGKPVTDFTVSGSEVTFTSNVEDGDRVRVLTYKYESPAGTQTVYIPANKFPQNVKIVMTTMEMTRDENPIGYLQFEFEEVKPSANFTIDTASERQAATRENTFRVLKPQDSANLGVLKRIPITEDPTP